MSTTTFKELSISNEMMKAIDEMGFINTTNVQAQTIPIIREGTDILAQSQTGTGKTMAFAIPAVESIKADVPNVQVLILSPTRELAQQCGDEVRKLTLYMPHVKTADIYGGADYNTQFKALRKANFVIGTPGRIMDHMKRGTLKLANLKMIILDEADEMLNMGFKEDIETILKDTPTERQTLLFSATVPKEILDITHEFQNNPTRINLVQDKATLKEITQVFIEVPKQQKVNVLKLLMFYHKPRRSIIFSNTKSMVDELAETLCKAGLSARGLHGDMRQNHRSSVMSEFKSGKTQVLVATDVAARGIDVSDIDYVFNFDIPKMTEYYVHRIGRTGRAGRTGTAITLCCGRQQISAIKQLAKKLQCNIDEISIPTVESIQMNELETNIIKVSDILANGKNPTPAQKMLVETLVDYGYTTEQIAVALAGIAFVQNTKGLVDLKVEKSSTKGKKGKKGEPFEGSFSNIILDIGRSSRCRPNHIVGAITERTGISSNFIGKIEIEDEFSVVGVPTEMMENILFDMQNIKICGRPVAAAPMPEKKKGKSSHSRHGKRFDDKSYSSRSKPGKHPKNTKRKKRK